MGGDLLQRVAARIPMNPPAILATTFSDPEVSAD